MEKSSRKRKRSERMFRFDNFCEPGQPILFTGSFQENVKALVAFGHPEARSVREGMQCWSFQLELHPYPSTCVRLFIAEEAVGTSLYRQCRYCQSVGWGQHMICNKRFHFVLPSKGTKLEMETLSTELSGKGPKKATAMGSKLMEYYSQGKYLMHGIMHSNGFGHLIAVNGIEAGSEFISGHQILDLWDRICTALQLRKVSITDAAKKGSMELRLIHGLAYGHPWFTHWGYKLTHGTYGITPQIYQTALDALRTLPLFLLIPHFACIAPEIPTIIAKYQTLSGGHDLLTLSDLFLFMIELNHRLPANSPPVIFDYHGLITEPTCRWSKKRVEMAAQVIVAALKKSELCWVTRQEVRDAARAYIGDTGLLDYVLKSLGNHIVGSYIVRRMVNPITKVLEYCLQDVSNQFSTVRFQVTRVQLLKDMFYLYKNILRDRSTMVVNGVFEAIPMAVRVILDAKHLAKDYNKVESSQVENHAEHLKIMCTISMICDEQIKKELPPYEMVALQSNATVEDLKKQVEKKFREVYLGLKSFTAERVSGVDARDTDFIVGVVETGSRVIVEGRVSSEDGMIYEGGGRVVDCRCGAKEDDGEQMVCCDICEVWQHTRCAGVEGEEEKVPHVFLCVQCEDNIAALPSI